MKRRAWSRQEDEAARRMKREGNEARQGDEADTGMKSKRMRMKQEGHETGRG